MTVRDLFFYLDMRMKLEGQPFIKIPSDHPVADKPFANIVAMEFTLHGGTKLKLIYKEAKGWDDAGWMVE